MARLVDDDVLHTFAVVGRPRAAARLLTERVGDLVDRVTLYTPYDVRRECVLEMAAELRDLSSDLPRTPASARQ
jgi:hypothetical protein